MDVIFTRVVFIANTQTLRILYPEYWVASGKEVGSIYLFNSRNKYCGNGGTAIVLTANNYERTISTGEYIQSTSVLISLIT